MGTVFSSMLVLEENPEKTEAQIDSIANLFLGVKQYIKFPDTSFRWHPPPGHAHARHR